MCTHYLSYLLTQWQGDFGPFTPQIVTQVPLWLAIALKKRGKCSIRPPQWMSVGELPFFLIPPPPLPTI